MVNRRSLGIAIVLFIILIVVLFGDAIFPTLSNQPPVRFDVTEGTGIDVNVGSP